MIELINYKGVCRTAFATRDLLNTGLKRYNNIEVWQIVGFCKG